jgi:hypothetical protein
MSRFIAMPFRPELNYFLLYIQARGHPSSFSYESTSNKHDGAA